MLTFEFIDPELQIASDKFAFIESFLKKTNRTQLGWHYITDITWIYSKISALPRDYKILDAGGGRGPLQFLLAELGFNVTNVDMTLSGPPPAYAQRYRTDVTILPSLVPTDYYQYLVGNDKYSLETIFKKIIKGSAFYKALSVWKYNFTHDRWRSQEGIRDTPVGEIQWAAGNLCNMPEIPSGSFDAVTSLSALEHIPIAFLDSALKEIRRVLKPNAQWAITTSGTEMLATWLHEPSQGYCFSSADLAHRFKADLIRPQDPAEILLKYRRNKYLRENLAVFYHKSGKNGMPWGRWEPQYIPVGISN